MKAFKATMALAAVTLLFATACSETETEWVTAPSISPTNAVVTAPDGGGTVSLRYSISNPVDDGTTTASASASWISDISVPSEGTVTFSAAENTAGEARTARVTITYSYSIAGTSGSVSCDVTVAQSCGDSPAVSVQPTAVAAAADGGSYSFEYTIVNPASDGQVEAAASESWVSDIDVATDGKVSFTVAANTGDLRSTEISLTYTWSGGSLSDCVTVVQDSASGSEPSPEISVTHPAITAVIEGGSYSFEYEVLNPASDGKMDVATDDDWITDLTDSNGTVSFSVEENTSVLRTGVIALTYTYSGGSVSETVTVVQDHVSGATLGIAGTYQAEGFGLTSSGNSGDTTWELYIVENPSDPDLYYVYCLTPYAGGLDVADAGESYWATGYYGEGENTFVIPSQVCSGRVNTSSATYYWGYTPCVQYSSGSYYYSGDYPDLVFTMTGDDEWESDYGIFAGGFTSTTISSFTSYFGVVAPTIKITKTGEAPDITSAALNSVSEKAGKSLDAREAHTAVLAK